ncbi:polyhomeotic-like protein 1 [Anopheles marshallii]|uniref:polyhomeotic-like protein 1 n=1 Tax=Anopheles marshallii TaxID=1521116 RepID=UPI00237C2D4D|nr:polyhomeotic-like protein 1 [Anopheles marshallii]
MSCHSTTRAQEDPYAFTESAPLQANSLAYANHSSAVSNSTSSSNSNAPTSTTIQTASSGASLLLATNSAGNVTSMSKDKVVSISPPVASSSPATLKVRYNGVVTTASPTTTAVVRSGPTTVGTPIPVYTKPVQIRQQSPQSALPAQSQPTVTVGKLIKKVLPQQKTTPMITTVVASGAKIISRLQQQNQSLPGGQQLSTTGGSILKFIKIPPQQLAKGTTAGATTIPQGSFIHVTTSGDGARKLIVTNSSSSSNGVTPTISVATTSGARIANVGTAVNRNAGGVTVVSNVSAVTPTKIRLVQPQAQGKFYLQTTANSSTVGTATHLSNPVTIATLRNTLIKQQQPPLQQQKPQPAQQQQQQPVQQKVLPSQQQQQASPTAKPQTTSASLPPQQKQQHIQQQLIQKQQKSQQLKQQQIVGNQSPQQLPHTLPKTSPQPLQAKPPTPSLQSQSLQKVENVDSTPKLQQKQQTQTSVQQQPQLVSKTLLQSAPNGQKQSLLLQQQQQQPSKQASSIIVQSVQQSQSLLLQPQRKQPQSFASAGNKQRTVPQQQPPKPATTSVGSMSLLTSSPITANKGSIFAKVVDTTRVSAVSPKEAEKSSKMSPAEGARRFVNQKSLLVTSNASTKSPQSRDQSPLVNRVEKVNRAPSAVDDPKVISAVAKKRSELEVVSGPVNIGGEIVSEIKATDLPTTLDIKTNLTIEEQTLPDIVNGKVRQMSGRKSGATGKTGGKQQKSAKRTHSQQQSEEQDLLRDCQSPVATVMTNIGSSPSCTTSTPNAPTRGAPGSTPTPSLLSTVKLEKEFEIKQEHEEQQDEKPPRLQRFVASTTVPGATAVPIKRPKIREWHAPGAYMFDLKDPGDESDDDVYDEYPNTLSFWYEESIAITVPDSMSSWGINPMHRSSSSSSSSVRGGKNKGNRSGNSSKFEIRMLTRDERLELRKAYLQRRIVQCRNGLRLRSAAASIAKKRLESMARVVAKVDKRRQTELNKASEKETCVFEGCSNPALVMTSHCYDHVTEESQQCLFQRCTAKFSDNSQCRVPVFDVSHELILCKEHAWKHDNHDKMSQEVKLHKKPVTMVTPVPVPASPTIAARKKAKPIQSPPVVVRSQKRPKKKKKLTPLQQQMLLHQQQYKQQFAMHHTHHQTNQSNQQQAKQATPASNQPPKKVIQSQQTQPQRSLLNTWSVNGKVQMQVKQVSPVQKASAIAHPGQRLSMAMINGSESPSKPAFNRSVSHTVGYVNRNLHIPAATGNNRTVSGAMGSTAHRLLPNNSTMEIVDSLELDHNQQQQPQQQQPQQQQQYSNGSHPVQTIHQSNTSPNTQDLLTICENSSAYASSEDTGVGGLSESELLATPDVIEEIIPFEFSNLLHPNVLSHLPPDALNELLYLGDVPAGDDTGDSHESCPREVEDDIERALEHVKSLDDMTVEPSSLLGDFLDNVDDEMLDGSDICNTEQMLQSPNKAGDIRGMVHT